MKTLTKLGALGFLSILGIGGACPAIPVYGPSVCNDTDCSDWGTGWYCDESSGRCRQSEPDAAAIEPDGGGEPDTGTSGSDAGQ